MISEETKARNRKLLAEMRNPKFKKQKADARRYRGNSERKGDILRYSNEVHAVPVGDLPPSNYTPDSNKLPWED